MGKENHQNIQGVEYHGETQAERACVFKIVPGAGQLPHRETTPEQLQPDEVLPKVRAVKVQLARFLEHTGARLHLLA